MKDKKRGVILLAMGHANYGNWALNLAFSIKYSDILIPVSIAYTGNALGHIERYKGNFDQVIELKKEMITRHGVTDYIKAKTYLYDISPYEETIFIDADVILFQNRKISDLFDKFKDIDFTIASREKKILKDTIDLHWARPKDIIEEYEYDGEVYNISSEFIYFKKTQKVKDMFDMAKKIYDDPGISFTKFNGSIADELPLMLSMAFNGLKPHEDYYMPFYWEYYQKKGFPIGKILDAGYFGYSMGGNMATDMMKRIYNGLSNFYAKQFGLKVGFPHRDKKSFLTTRNQI